MDRSQLADRILERIAPFAASLRQDFHAEGRVHSFVVDDLLGADVAGRIAEAFPTLGAMQHNRTLREDKHIAVQMDRYAPLCEEAIFAFQDQRVIELIENITGIDELEGDPQLYAGGLSSMARGQFLNPHVDNSHDRDRQRYRALNLLYYVTPDWRVENGGNLELWDDGLGGQPRVIESRFDRLVVMATNKTSWHSVQPVTIDGRRNCVSNYYFTEKSPEDADYFHPTTFRGRPDQPLRDVVLRLDGWARAGIRKLARKGVKQTSHVYEKTRD